MSGPPTAAPHRAKPKQVAKAAAAPASQQILVQPVMITPEQIHHTSTVVITETAPRSSLPNAAAPQQAATSYSNTGALRAQLIAGAMRYIGRPYVWGGATPEGFDCSGFVQYAFASLGIRIPRTADDQFYALPATNDPRPGDLVFFQTYLPGPSHVGIYLGNGYFVNSIGTQVQVSSFTSSYFTSRYLGARRAFAD
jgi:cell wall-associated NlpC family hydrolase